MSLAERLYRLAWSRMLRPQRWIATGHALCQSPLSIEIILMDRSDPSLGAGEGSLPPASAVHWQTPSLMRPDGDYESSQ